MSHHEENPELDKARAKALGWATEPITEQGKHSASHLDSDQPCALSLYRAESNRSASFATAKYYIPREQESDSVLYADVDFDPKYHYTIEQVVCLHAKNFIDNYLASTTSIKGKRAEKVLETVKDIGRPHQGLFGGLGQLFGNKDDQITTSGVELNTD
jgi:hypothetical protein